MFRPYGFLAGHIMEKDIGKRIANVSISTEITLGYLGFWLDITDLPLKLHYLESPILYEVLQQIEHNKSEALINREKNVAWNDFICSFDRYLFTISKHEVICSTLWIKLIWVSTVKISLGRASRVKVVHEELEMQLAMERWTSGRVRVIRSLNLVGRTL